MTRYLLCATVLLTLTGCVVVVDYPTRPTVTMTQTTATEVVTPNTTTITSPDAPDDPPPEPKAMSSPRLTCAPFALPAPEPLPAIVDLTDPLIKTQQDVELALVQQIEILREYIRAERQALTEAHAAYVTRCRE